MGTGGAAFAIRTIVYRPNLELVGAWVHSARKDGEDVGTLAGIAPVGVRASRDEATVLGGDADCVVYAAPAGSRPKEALADLCRILAAGKNVVTTSLPGLVYERGSLSERYLDAIRQAAHAGSSSIFSSGVEPGFGCDLFPIALMTSRTRCTPFAASKSPTTRDTRSSSTCASCSGSASRWTIRAA